MGQLWVIIRSRFDLLVEWLKRVEDKQLEKRSQHWMHTALDNYLDTEITKNYEKSTIRRSDIDPGTKIFKE